MNIILCEAAHDENGQLGYEPHLKGDQTADEVRNIKYYNKPWTYVFRWKNEDMRKSFAITMQQAVDNAHIGYGQPARLDLFYALPSCNYDPSKLTVDVDCDCSALVNALVYYRLLTNGIKTSITGHETTAMMPEKYLAETQWFENVTNGVNLETGEGLMQGDILVRPMSHTAAVWRVESDDPEQTGVATTDLYLRQSPVNGKIITTIKQNEIITILDEIKLSSGAIWYKAKYRTSTGYCSARYVRKIQNVCNLLCGERAVEIINDTITRTLPTNLWIFDYCNIYTKCSRHIVYKGERFDLIQEKEDWCRIRVQDLLYPDNVWYPWINKSDCKIIKQ